MFVIFVNIFYRAANILGEAYMQSAILKKYTLYYSTTRNQRRKISYFFQNGGLCEYSLCSNALWMVIKNSSYKIESSLIRI